MLTAHRVPSTLAAAAPLLALLAGGCGPEAPANAVKSCEQLELADDATDVLFVVDDSGSMSDKQQNLADNFQGFIERLAGSATRNLYQVAVVTSSVNRYDFGAFPDTYISSTVCPASPLSGQPYPKGAIVSVSGPDDPTRRVLSTTQPPRILSAGSPTLVQDFRSNVFVGVCGSGREQGMEAARLALSEPLLSGANAGLVRRGARLVVVFVSDDDDCSDPQGTGTSEEPPGCTSYPVQNYVDFLRGPIGGEPKDLLVAAIVAVDPSTLQPSQCRVQGTGAEVEHAAYRYRQLVDAFGTRGIVDSVCNASFYDTLVAIASRISQEVPLASAPADPRLLAVAVIRADGTRQACTVRTEGDPGTSDVVYIPPTGSRPPSLVFGGACELESGDRVDVKLLCVG
jgi:hypothetical protein